MVGHHKLRRGLGRCLNRVSDTVDRAGHQALLHDQYSKSSGMNEAQEGQDRDVGVTMVWMKVIIEVLRGSKGEDGKEELRMKLFKGIKEKSMRWR